MSFSERDQETIKKYIWVAMLALPFLLGVVAIFTLAFRTHKNLALGMTAFMSIVALVAASLTFLLRQKKLLKERRRQDRRDLSDMLENNAEFARQILIWFLSQSVAFCGFLLAILFAKIDYYVIFAGISVVLLIIHRPLTYQTRVRMQHQEK